MKIEIEGMVLRDALPYLYHDLNVNQCDEGLKDIIYEIECALSVEDDS